MSAWKLPGQLSKDQESSNYPRESSAATRSIPDSKWVLHGFGNIFRPKPLQPWECGASQIMNMKRRADPKLKVYMSTSLHWQDLSQCQHDYFGLLDCFWRSLAKRSLEIQCNT